MNLWNKEKLMDRPIYMDVSAYNRHNTFAMDLRRYIAAYIYNANSINMIFIINKVKKKRKSIAFPFLINKIWGR